MSRNRPRVLRQQMRYKAWTRARSKDMMAPPTAVAVGCLMKVTVCRPTMRRATPIPETVAVAACAPSRNRGNSRSRVPQCGGAPMASLFHTNFAHRHLRISVRTASTSNMLNMSSASRAGGGGAHSRAGAGIWFASGAIRAHYVMIAGSGPMDARPRASIA